MKTRAPPSIHQNRFQLFGVRAHHLYIAYSASARVNVSVSGVMVSIYRPHKRASRKTDACAHLDAIHCDIHLSWPIERWTCVGSRGRRDAVHGTPHVRVRPTRLQTVARGSGVRTAVSVARGLPSLDVTQARESARDH